MRLPVPGPRDVMSALERGSEQVEALLGAVPRMLALLDEAEALVARASAIVDRVEVVADAATAEVARVSVVVDGAVAQIDRVGSVADDAQKQIDRVGSVADDAQKQIDRVGSVADDAQKQIDRVGSVVGGAAVQADRAAALLDVLEPPLTTLQPTLQTLADTTHPEEVAALVTLVDHLPAVTEQFERDILPVLATLGSVAPDLHDLLDVSRELNEILGKIPGLGRIKRRVEEEDEDNGR
jgi:ABC-type transporter Mla subunit MlaD